MAVQQPAQRSGNWATTIGQLCAYGGVAVLTLGTVMVLSGYFGGPINYAPTGWLVAAVGQMLLFLGVVTLVSGGMEQTVDEVSWRIDHLAEQLMRLEQMVSDQQSAAADARRREQRAARMQRRDQSDAA
jgi:outer membrane murein-binding lipoprotein Lpp